MVLKSTMTREQFAEVLIEMMGVLPYLQTVPDSIRHYTKCGGVTLRMEHTFGVGVDIGFNLQHGPSKKDKDGIKYVPFRVDTTISTGGSNRSLAETVVLREMLDAAIIYASAVECLLGRTDVAWYE